MLPLLQEVAVAAQSGPHPLSGTIARWLWLVPLLPFLGFLINGALSLSAAYHAGPADPSLAHGDDHGHGPHVHDSADAHGAHGDDHHVVVRHRYAGITSLVGPGVLVLSFLLTAGIWMAMRAAGGGA